MNVNKKYKNNVFTALFSNEEALRELYNALYGEDPGKHEGQEPWRKRSNAR